MSLSGPKKKSAIRPMTPISAQPRPNKPICTPETEVRRTATCGRSGEAATTGSVVTAGAARTRDDASAGSGENAAAVEQSARKRPTTLSDLHMMSDFACATRRLQKNLCALLLRLSNPLVRYAANHARLKLPLLVL